MNNITVLDHNEDNHLTRDHYIEQLQTIHGLRDALGLELSDYRDLLYRLTGSNSAKYMTAEQRQRVITFMQVHRALDEAIEQAEVARDVLNQSYESNVNRSMEKVILLDGKPTASMHASIEEVIETMRRLHGEVMLCGASERQVGDKTVLDLEFRRPAVYLLAS